MELPPDVLARGYRVNAVTIQTRDRADLPQIDLELNGRSQPIGTSAAKFSEFAIYNDMIYDRARGMYSHLRDLMGDSTYVRFLHAYYDEWAFKHVDERALRTVAARVYGKDLGWFFNQWVHQTGLLDYALGGYSVTRDASGKYITNVEVDKRGQYAHPMPVGIHTSKGWNIARAHAELDRQILQITTSEPPDSIVIDPFHVTWDWDRRNDNVRNPRAHVGRSPGRLRLALSRPGRSVAYRCCCSRFPRSGLTGPPRCLHRRVRARTNYLGSVDRYDAGLAMTMRNPQPVPGGSIGPFNRVQFWFRGDNLYLPLMSRPLMGYQAGIAHLDGITKVDASRTWDLSPFIGTPGPKISAKVGFDGAYPSQGPLLPEQWTNTNVSEGSASFDYQTTPSADGTATIAHAEIGGGYADPRHAFGARGYARMLGSVTSVMPLVVNQRTLTVRVVGGWSPRAPEQRSIFASSMDPFETFDNNYYRPSGALFKQTNVNFRPLGGAGLRGYSPLLALDQVVAANGEGEQKLRAWQGGFGRMTAFATVFGDVAAVHASSESLVTTSQRLLADGGVGVTLRGRFYDRDIKMRLDFPLALSDPGLRLGRASGNGSFAFRWAFSLNDLW